MDISIMAVYTDVLNENISFPNIDIYNILKDGVLNGYKVKPQDGYVMYDTTDEHTDFVFDEEQGMYVEVPVIHYFTEAILPLNFNFNNFSWVAVLRSEVDENYIFGGGDEPEHEVM